MSGVKQKLITLHDKIKQLTTDTIEFKTNVKSKLEKLKPKISTSY